MHSCTLSLIRIALSMKLFVYLRNIHVCLLSADALTDTAPQEQELIGDSSTAAESVVDTLDKINLQEITDAIDVDEKFLPDSLAASCSHQSNNVQTTTPVESSHSPLHSECNDIIESTCSPENCNDSSTSAPVQVSRRGRRRRIQSKSSPEIKNCSNSSNSAPVEVGRKRRCLRMVPASSRSNIAKRSRLTNVVCSICTKTFDRRIILINHLRNNHGQHACTRRTCDSTFQSAADLDDHIRVDHANERPYVCDTCCKSFSVPNSLRRHIDVAHLNSADVLPGNKKTKKQRRCQEPQVCYLCGATLNSLNTLASHIKGHLLPYSCDGCARRFRSMYELKEHGLACKTGDSQPFQCDVCGTRFTLRGNLRRHRLSHKGNSVCHVCGKSFRHKQSLDEHMKLCHQKGALWCSLCELSFHRPDRLEEHMERHAKRKINTFACSVCGRKLSTQWKLADHMVLHYGQKCETCGKEFEHRSDLKRHVHVHSEVKYSCPVVGCTEQFRIRVNMFRHAKNVHGLSREDILIKPETEENATLPDCLYANYGDDVPADVEYTVEVSDNVV